MGGGRDRGGPGRWGGERYGGGGGLVYGERGGGKRYRGVCVCCVFDDDLKELTGAA